MLIMLMYMQYTSNSNKHTGIKYLFCELTQRKVPTRTVVSTTDVMYVIVSYRCSKVSLFRMCYLVCHCLQRKLGTMVYHLFLVPEVGKLHQYTLPMK
jgi:hypothetical protein